MKRNALELLKSMTEEERVELLRKAEAGEDMDEDEDDAEDLEKAKCCGTMVKAGEKCGKCGKMAKSIAAGEQEALQKGLDAVEERLRREGVAIPSASERLGGEATSMAKSMDGTGFVTELVNGTAAHLDDLGGRIGDLVESGDVTNTAVLAIGHSVLSLRKSLDALGANVQRMNDVLGAPAAPRTVMAAPLNKAFQRPGAGDGGGPAPLTKSQISGKLLKAQVAADRAGDRHEVARVQEALISFQANGRRTAQVDEIIGAAG